MRFTCKHLTYLNWNSFISHSEAPTDICTCDTSSLITAVMLHEGRWRVTRNGFTESAQKPTDVFCGTSALYVFPILHWWTPPPEQMNQWNFGISMNKLISVFVGCQGLRSRLQKLVYNMCPDICGKKHRGTSIGNDIREVIRPHFHDHNRCTSFFCCWGGGKSKFDLEEPAWVFWFKKQKSHRKWTVTPPKSWSGTRGIIHYAF